ncbi:unnamed protein product [Ectocarpus sp. 12 AP-2014]
MKGQLALTSTPHVFQTKQESRTCSTKENASLYYRKHFASVQPLRTKKNLRATVKLHLALTDPAWKSQRKGNRWLNQCSISDLLLAIQNQNPQQQRRLQQHYLNTTHTPTRAHTLPNQQQMTQRKRLC